MNFSSSSDYINFLHDEKCAFADRYLKKGQSHKTRDSFDIVRLIGIGSFGRVLLVQDKEDETFYAVKVLIKKFIVNTGQVEKLLSERRILQSLNFIFTVKLMYFFMDNSYVYLVMPFVSGGDLYNRFEEVRSFSEDDARFYAAQIILALEYLHNFEVAYRDLKPENILIDERGYLKLTDFGLSKIVTGRTYTLCGTPDYIAPEIYLNKGYGKTVDFWALGIVIFELCAGYPPFIAPDLMRMYELITTAKFKTPDYFTRNLKCLLKSLIQNDMSRRLGNLKHGIEDIKNHPWFTTVNWLTLLNCEVRVPFVPKLSGPGDSDYFDPLYMLETDEYLVDDTDPYKKLFVLF